MRVAITKFKDDTFCLSDGDSTLLVENQYEAVLWTSWKLKKDVRLVKSDVDLLKPDHLMVITEDFVTFEKIDYSEMFYL